MLKGLSILADDSALPGGAPKEPAQVISALCTKLEQLGAAGRKTVGVDSVKLRAQNSKKNNYNEKKLRRHQTYIANKIRQYMKEMNEADEEGYLEGWARKQQAFGQYYCAVGAAGKNTGSWKSNWSKAGKSRYPPQTQMRELLPCTGIL
ncbi:MAG: hypothetical protein H6557_04870 [Lewinellaceae bacterium]|nr:hypothetical protein [Lewinellaceae bacterium]